MIAMNLSNRYFIENNAWFELIYGAFEQRHSVQEMPNLNTLDMVKPTMVVVVDRDPPRDIVAIW